MGDNSKIHPEAWEFFVKYARNIDSNEYKYCISEPNKTGNYIYANCPQILWSRFIKVWYSEDIN